MCGLLKESELNPQSTRNFTEMRIKLFFSCLALLAVIVQSTSSVAEKKDSVSKYSLKLSGGTGREYDEEIEIDTEKETETFHVPKRSPDEEAGDIIYDFKKNITMIRLPAAKACYFSDSTDDVLKPADLLKALELVPPGADGRLPMARTETKLTVVGTLKDRSELSDEMADLCAKLPIYTVMRGDVDPVDIPQTRKTTDPANVPKARVKRLWGNLVRLPVRRDCRWRCNWVGKRVCRLIPDEWGDLRKVCNFVREWVCKYGCTIALG